MVATVIAATAIVAIATAASAAVDAATAIPPPVKRAPTPRLSPRTPAREMHHEHDANSGAPSVLSPAQDLSLLGRQSAEDRLQGREALAALCVGARQDGAEPHHCGIRQETA